MSARDEPLSIRGPFDVRLPKETPMAEPATYRKVPHDDEGATQLWFIVADAGWREWIVCERMYGWAADWLLGLLEGHQAPTEGDPK